ncbi:MAG: DnaT-like ssDNA-binding protein [Vicinamibacteria bacterium]
MAEEPDFLNAIPGDEAANSYLTLTEADERMSEFESFDAWDELDEDDQARLLIRGTRLIDRYGGWGAPLDENQRLAFPRSIDEDDEGNGVIPDGLKRALLEYVDFRLQDEDGARKALKDLQAEGVTSTSMLGQSSTFEKDESELPAGARRELDRLKNRVGTDVANRPYVEGGDETETFFG